MWITPAQGPVETNRSVHRTWWMRQALSVERVPAQAALSVVCLGYYELYVNGERVDAEPLAPSLTRLDRRAFEIDHDLAGHLMKGENCIAIWCSCGWYLPHQFDVHENATPLLRIEASGFPLKDRGWWCRASNRCVIGEWKWNKFGGEDVDAREALPEWNRVQCSLVNWHAARLVSAPPVQVTQRTCPPNRIGEIYPAQSCRRLSDGRYEIDFGICLSGWVDFMLPDLAAGESVTLQFYDLPADNNRVRDHSYGQYSVYHACGDGNDRFTNKFNYAGFRYVTIQGLAKEPEIAGMRAMLVETAMDRTGHFQCSNVLYNRIHELNLQTLRCLNLGGYSVDCPHRERQGYGADGQSALPAYLYMLDAHAFLRKWLTDWCDVYEPETGRIRHTAPTGHPKCSPAWGGIVAPLAWALYVYYGDRDALVQALPRIEGYIRFLQTAVENGIMRRDLLGDPFHADWVPPRREMRSGNRPTVPMKELFNSCYQIYLWQLYLKICTVLGKDDHRAEAEAHIATMQERIHREYYDEEQGLYLLPEQTYQVMPLLTGVVPPELRGAIRQKLLALIEEQDWHVDTGVPGTTLLLDLLVQYEEHELIGKIYQQDTYPSWGHMLAKGATTIWEQWDGEWSQIHSCFAGPAAWFYEGLAGIRPDAAGPGFKAFTLAPAFIEGLSFVDASFDSPAGRIVSAWQREQTSVRWRVEVPPGSTASVVLPLHASEGFRVNDTERHAETNAIACRLTGGQYVIAFEHVASELTKAHA